MKNIWSKFPSNCFYFLFYVYKPYQNVALTIPGINRFYLTQRFYYFDTLELCVYIYVYTYFHVLYVAIIFFIALLIPLFMSS